MIVIILNFILLLIVNTPESMLRYTFFIWFDLFQDTGFIICLLVPDKLYRIIFYSINLTIVPNKECKKLQDTNIR